MYFAIFFDFSVIFFKNIFSELHVDRRPIKIFSYMSGDSFQIFSS